MDVLSVKHSVSTCHSGIANVIHDIHPYSISKKCNTRVLDYKIFDAHYQHLSGIQDIIEWTEVRRREWDAHVGRMEVNRLAKIARDSRPQGVRSRDRPKKLWKESLIKAPPALTSGRTGVSL
jgi:hypothetical protein